MRIWKVIRKRAGDRAEYRNLAKQLDGFKKNRLQGIKEAKEEEQSGANETF